jgi:hypothetical protein
MKTENKQSRWLVFFASLLIILFFSGSVSAIDDGARSYWHAREGTNVVSFQRLNVDIDASSAKQFGPGQYIYPNASVDADLVIASYTRFLTMFNRPSSLTFALAGGHVDLDLDVSKAPSQFIPTLPPGFTGNSFSQSASGFADPTIQLVTNLFGTPPLRSNVDLLNYEPTWTLDAAAMLGVPVGEYDEKKLVNLGQNRWFGRFALPLKYHWGAFTPGYRKTFEITPSVWIFEKNDDFLGQKLENDPMWQLESHLTKDFTRDFYGSLDALYRKGFQSEIDGVEVGDELDIGSVGFTLNYQLNDNCALRAGFSSNVFGDSDLDTNVFRIQIVFGWHDALENLDKLMGGGH